MHVDWHWIRQRPQALADELDRMDDFRVLVAYLPNFRRRRLGHNPSTVRRMPIPQIPLGSRLAVGGLANRWLARGFLGFIGRIWHPDVVLVPHPNMYELLPASLRTVPLIYDCMDHAPGFGGDAASLEKLQRNERELAGLSAALIVSSEFLAQAIQPILPGGRAAVLIRNGTQASGAAAVPAPTRAVTDPIRLAYYGTISDWLDRGLLQDLLDAEPMVEVHLWGPLEVKLPHHPRLIWHGVIPHRDLPSAVAGTDALIMPFVISDLIRGVDPVKLYEYVGLGKPVISIFYPELEQFRDHVNFYADLDELRALIDRLRTNAGDLAPERASASAFLARSSWSARAEQMAGVIRDVIRHQREAASSVPGVGP